MFFLCTGTRRSPVQFEAGASDRPCDAAVLDSNERNGRFGFLEPVAVVIVLGRDVSWFYLEYDALLSGRSPWVLVLAKVFFRKVIDMRVSTFECL